MSSLRFVLGLGGLDGLPLHIARRIRSAAFQWHNVVDDVLVAELAAVDELVPLPEITVGREMAMVYSIEKLTSR